MVSLTSSNALVAPDEPPTTREKPMPHNALGARLPRKEHPVDHPLLLVRQAADMLGCSEMTIRRRSTPASSPQRIGRRAMVPRAFVEQLLAAADAGETVVVEEFALAWAAGKGAQR